MRILVGGGGVVGRVCGSTAVLALGWLLGVAPGGPAMAQSASEAAHGGQLFGARCALCHAAEGGGGGQGPSLAGVVGRKAAAADFPYSRALRGAGLTWSPDQIDRYLADPQALVPGTRMPVKVTAADERHALIAYLATLKAPPAASPDPAAAASAAPNGTPPGALLTGQDAFGDWRRDAPGVRRLITAADLPPPFESRSTGNAPEVVERAPDRKPVAPPGFRVDLFATALDNPRVLRVAPNGDVFVAQTATGRIGVLRAKDGAGQAEPVATFATGLDAPFGIAFYPPGPDPRFVYVAETNRVLRFPYRAGDLRARGTPEVVVPRLAASTGGHSTRDLAFSADGTRLYVSVGSGSNVAEGLPPRLPAWRATWEAAHGLGAAWDTEEGRADVLSFTPEGADRQVFATGLRNCVGLAVHPRSGDLWCSTNERDGLGDNLVPDYLTRVRAGAYYGWPWYYVGNHEDPRLKGQRPDLDGRMTDPDVLLQPHSASLGMTFYTGAAFPAAYRGDAFAAEHGSWNRAKRTGYKVVRARLRDGVPTGEYEDFLTGFIIDDHSVWGRPVGIAVAHDGALLVAEDGNDTVWRIAYVGAEP